MRLTDDIRPSRMVDQNRRWKKGAAVRYAWLLALVFCVGCGKPQIQPQALPTATVSSVSLQGAWLFQTSIVQGMSPLSYSEWHVTLTPAACEIATIAGPYSQTGQNCYLATYGCACDAGSEAPQPPTGDISGTGDFYYDPLGVLAVAPAGELSSGAQVGLMFVEQDTDAADTTVLLGTGTVGANGAIAGTWTCDLDSPGCAAIQVAGETQSLNGTFTGVQQ